jgi:hypothetical protein
MGLLPPDAPKIAQMEQKCSVDSIFGLTATVFRGEFEPTVQSSTPSTALQSPTRKK